MQNCGFSEKVPCQCHTSSICSCSDSEQPVESPNYSSGLERVLFTEKNKMFGGGKGSKKQFLDFDEIRILELKITFRTRYLAFLTDSGVLDVQNAPRKNVLKQL